MKSVLCIGELKANPCEKVQGFINILDTDRKIPVTIINGAKEGKTILITSGIHGAEYPAIKAAIELAKEIEAEEISGQVIIVHPVNTEGFENRRAAIVPEDGKNLNNIFPGDEKGSIADKIAYVIAKEFQSKADYYLDIHGGDLHEDLIPHLYYSGKANSEVIDKIKKVAKVLNLKYMIKSNTTNGAHSYASISGLPSMLIERGSCGLCNKEDVILYKKDIYNIFSLLKIIDREVEKNENTPIDITEAVYLEASNSGCWTCYVKAGEMIKVGQKLGEVTDYFGNIIDTYYSEFDGVVLYQTVALSVPKGSSLVAYGKIK